MPICSKNRFRIYRAVSSGTLRCIITFSVSSRLSGLKDWIILSCRNLDRSIFNTAIFDVGRRPPGRAVGRAEARKRSSPIRAFIPDTINKCNGSQLSLTCRLRAAAGKGGCAASDAIVSPRQNCRLSRRALACLALRGLRIAPRIDRERKPGQKVAKRK